MSKCDYCGNENSCRTCGLTYEDGVAEGRKKAVEDFEKMLKMTLSMSTKSHSEKDIYEGCIGMMTKMVEYFGEYLDYIGVKKEDLDPDDKFLVSMMPTEIVRMLFLQKTSHSGGTSCRKKCEELGIDVDKPVRFQIDDDLVEE